MLNILRSFYYILIIFLYPMGCQVYKLLIKEAPLKRAYSDKRFPRKSNDYIIRFGVDKNYTGEPG